MTARRSKEETKLQKRIVVHLRKNFNCVVNHSPNGGERGLLAAIEFKAMGVLAGYPDLEIQVAPGRSFFMEIKAEKGALSDNQKRVIGELRDRCFQVAVVHSFDEALLAFKAWGLPPKPPHVRAEPELRTGF